VCFKPNECNDVSIQLLSNGRDIDSTSLSDGRFKFEGVSPGAYNILIHGHNQICWDVEETSIRIESSNVNELIFRQIGYRVEIDTPKEAILVRISKEY
jgi:hypothetical protein